MEPAKFEVTVGYDERDYRIGDFLNAIDELVCYFQNMDYQQEDDDFANALEMYAYSLRKKD